jgi:diketogulonate reductase-like aldo/keto reductase
MQPTRRTVLEGVLATAVAGSLFPVAAGAQAAPAQRAVPSTGETIPAIGLGTWITFNVGADQALRDECAGVMEAFFASGGRMIDSSPMYGSSQAVIGYGLAKLGYPKSLFSAEKVWISPGDDGPEQIEETRKLWGLPRFDLLQVHNLLAWEEHLRTLFAMKAEGKVRYVGVTTSHGRRHAEIEKVMREHPLDFVQVTYNVLDREVEERILPLALEKRIAVITNRPFRQGALIDSVKGEKLPDSAGEFGAANWAQFLLKFVVSHPAVTCAIPATSKVAHLRENMGASFGPLPDEATRRRMIAYVEGL